MLFPLIGTNQTDVLHGEDGYRCNSTAVQCAISDTVPTPVHLEPTHAMTTRGQLITKGIMEWAEMEAGWQVSGRRRHRI